LNVDERLNNGGLEEVADMKRKCPPIKSPLMKILTDTMDRQPGQNAITGGGGAPGDENLMLDSIGCTSNVILLNHQKKKLFVANAGDSRCVMGHGGKCKALSFDHKPES